MCMSGKLEAAWRPETNHWMDNGLPISRQLHGLHTGCTPVARRLHTGRHAPANGQVGGGCIVHPDEALVATYVRIDGHNSTSRGPASL
jgi:hypothetical protein